MPFLIGRTAIHRSGRAEELLAVQGKTFHFATRFFPARYRQAIVVLYAFFRTLDDLVDARTGDWQAKVVRQELEDWQAWFEGELMTGAPREPLGTKLAVLVREYRVPHSLFLDFLAGLLSDLEPRTFSCFQELHRYCYQVAGTVGLTMTHVLGNTSEQALLAAHDLGIAMQLTNILRDVGRDLADGRIYLPLDELARFGLTPPALVQLARAQREPDARLRALMRAQIARARRYYLSGLHGVWLLRPECRLPILLAGRLYQNILLDIERRRYDVLRGRAATSLFTKLREAGVVFLLDLLWRAGEIQRESEQELLYENEILSSYARHYADNSSSACSPTPVANRRGRAH